MKLATFRDQAKITSGFAMRALLDGNMVEFDSLSRLNTNQRQPGNGSIATWAKRGATGIAAFFTLATASGFAGPGNDTTSIGGDYGRFAGVELVTPGKGEDPKSEDKGANKPVNDEGFGTAGKTADVPGKNDKPTIVPPEEKAADENPSKVPLSDDGKTTDVGKTLDPQEKPGDKDKKEGPKKPVIPKPPTIGEEEGTPKGNEPDVKKGEVPSGVPEDVPDSEPGKKPDGPVAEKPKAKPEEKPAADNSDLIEMTVADKWHKASRNSDGEFNRGALSRLLAHKLEENGMKLSNADLNKVGGLLYKAAVEVAKENGSTNPDFVLKEEKYTISTGKMADLWDAITERLASADKGVADKGTVKSKPKSTGGREDGAGKGDAEKTSKPEKENANKTEVDKLAERVATLEAELKKNHEADDLLKDKVLDLAISMINALGRMSTAPAGGNTTPAINAEKVKELKALLESAAATQGKAQVDLLKAVELMKEILDGNTASTPAPAATTPAPAATTPAPAATTPAPAATTPAPGTTGAVTPGTVAPGTVTPTPGTVAPGTVTPGTVAPGTVTGATAPKTLEDLSKKVDTLGTQVKGIETKVNGMPKNLVESYGRLTQAQKDDWSKQTFAGMTTGDKLSLTKQIVTEMPDTTRNAFVMKAVTELPDSSKQQLGDLLQTDTWRDIFAQIGVGTGVLAAAVYGGKKLFGKKKSTVRFGAVPGVP